MYIGADYYLEHWPQEHWETDARMMHQAGFNIVRLAEFARIDLEPREDDGRQLLSLINHTKSEQHVTVPADKVEPLTETETEDALALDRYEVPVIQLG